MSARESDPRVYREGWTASLGGLKRDGGRYITPAMREAWCEGYDDAKAEREKDASASNPTQGEEG